MLLGYGLVNVDDVVVVKQLVYDGKTTSETTFRQVGGPVPVALQTYTRLGGTTSFAGTIGDDLPGKYLIDRLNETITNPCLCVGQNATTSRSIVLVERESGARTIVNIPATTTSPPDISCLTRQLGPGITIHLDGRDLDTSLVLANAARNAGALVSIDLGTMRPGREALLSLCDIIIASKSGSAGLTPDHPDDIERQLSVMRHFGANVVGITLAEQGVVVGDRTKTYHLPAFQVDTVVDTNGAGDCFHGAFLYAYANLTKNLVESAKFAQASVAIKIKALGNDVGLPEFGQVMDFLRVE